MLSLYLYLNAGLYLILSVCCAAKPAMVTNNAGYSFLNTRGKIEYTIIYAGIEAMLAAFIGLSAYFPALQYSGLVLCVCLYAGIMLTRALTFTIHGVQEKTSYFIGALEYILGIWGIVLLNMESAKLNIQ